MSTPAAGTTANAPPARPQPERADLVIGIPTYNHADSIGQLLSAARAALQQFPGRTGLIVQADGGSTDGTIERARELANGAGALLQISYPLYPVHKLALSQYALPGRESAYRAIFSTALAAGASACCVVEPEGAAVTGTAISAMVQPIMEGRFDLAAPRYQRHRYEGLLVNGLLYPVVRALFGKALRQPVGSDYAFSGAFVERSLAAQGWDSEAAKRQIDLWLIVNALRSEQRICQVSLGSRPQTRSTGGAELSTVFADAVGTLFDRMADTADVWQRIRSTQAVPSLGLREDFAGEPAPPDTKTLLDSFRLGCRSLQDVWALLLPPATVLELRKLSRQADDSFVFPAALWAQVVYDFAIAYRQRTIARDQLLGALLPLYMGWAGSFIHNVKALRSGAVEDQIEAVCHAFEARKPHLISGWRWPDRFKP